MSGKDHPHVIRHDEPGFSRKILKTIAVNNPKSCRLRGGRLRASALHVHILRHGLAHSLELVVGKPTETARYDVQVINELIRMFEG